MYTVDHLDRVTELNGVPQSSVGAPCPIVLASEHSLLVAFYLEEAPPDWDGTSARIVGVDTDGEPVALVHFTRPCASMFGPPNDEAFSGHPLAERGLRPYGAYEVHESSWIRQLERMNSVHPHHQPARFSILRHIILSFHDTTFECVATDYRVEITCGALRDIAANAARALPGLEQQVRAVRAR